MVRPTNVSAVKRVVVVSCISAADFCSFSRSIRRRRLRAGGEMMSLQIDTLPSFCLTLHGYGRTVWRHPTHSQPSWLHRSVALHRISDLRVSVRSRARSHNAEMHRCGTASLRSGKVRLPHGANASQPGPLHPEDGLLVDRSVTDWKRESCGS